MNLRHAARAIILDEQDRVPAGTVVWGAPGGGIEDGEAPLATLRRELAEEVGLVVEEDRPHVWHQRVVATGHAAGYDGVINDYFLIRTASFCPRGTMSDHELAAENLTGFRWWRLPDVKQYSGPELFSPRDLATNLAALLTGPLPGTPLPWGL